MPVTHYNTAQEAYQHQSKLESSRLQYNTKENEADTYQEQIDALKETGLQSASWDVINDLTRLKEHQDFLHKLLTNKDSFIRKRIIEQNLTYLNSRLAYYLTKLGLPHEVQFISDLSVEITELGRELDFDNLSRGERNRLILGLSWAFRDVFETMNTPLNFMAIDELIDSGMDTNGVDNALGVLKKIERERNKNIFLISHRDELQGRVNTILQVIKQDGFTTFSTDTDYVSTV
jgi:DNA repair exonuclease SbcCD ATPase subunit